MGETDATEVGAGKFDLTKSFGNLVGVDVVCSDVDSVICWAGPDLRDASTAELVCELLVDRSK